MALQNVLLLPDQLLPTTSLGKALAPLFEMHPVDMRQHLRYCGGQLFEAIEEDRAQRVAAICTELSVAVAVVPHELRVTLPVIDVREAYFDGTTLSCEHPKHPLQLASEGIALIELIALPQSESTGATSPLHGIPIKSGFPFEGPRRYFLEQSFEPWVHAIRRTPFEVYRISRGTLFPDYAEVMGGLWLDNLLTFLHHLLSSLPASKIAAETVRFWSGDASLPDVTDVRQIDASYVAATRESAEPDGADPGSRSNGGQQEDRPSDDDENDHTRSIRVQKKEEIVRRLGWQRQLFEHELWGPS